MKLTAEQLTAFLDARKRQIADIVAPDKVNIALAEIHIRIGERLSSIKDEPSLDSLVNVEAVDFALKKYYARFSGREADRSAFDDMLAWNNRFVEAQIAKTIGVHLAWPDDASIVKAETIEAMWDLRENFSPNRGPYVPWARGIARNKTRSHRPFDKRNISIESGKEKPMDLPARGPSPEDTVVEGHLAAVRHGPPPQAFAELLQILSEAEPHKAIAFVFNRYLRMKPSEVGASIREMSLPEALAEAARILKRRYPEIAGIDAIFAPLAGRAAGCEGKFGDYADDAESIEKYISRWGDTTLHSVGDRTVQKGKKFLRFVCNIAAAAHQIVCFLWIRILYSPPVTLRHAAQRSLMQLVVGFEERYARRELLAAEQVEWCTDPLRKRAPKDRSLDDFAGADLYASLQRWCEHIDLIVARAATGEHLLGYAYIMGSLRRGKDRF
jgi:hypothetical protein